MANEANKADSEMDELTRAIVFYRMLSFLHTQMIIYPMPSLKTGLPK